MMTRNQPFNLEEKRLELLRRLNEISGVDPPDDFTKVLIIPLKVLADTQSLAKFQEVVEWTIEEVKGAQQEVGT
jgi:hypothetical protein